MVPDVRVVGADPIEPHDTTEPFVNRTANPPSQDAIFEIVPDMVGIAPPYTFGFPQNGVFNVVRVVSLYTIRNIPQFGITALIDLPDDANVI